MENEIVLDKRIFDDIFYALNTLIVIIGHKKLTQEEETKLKFITKMFEDHSTQINKLP